MRSLDSLVRLPAWALALATVLVLGLRAPAARALPFTATLTLTYLDPGASVSGGGSGSSVDGAGGAFSLPAGFLSVSGTTATPAGDAPFYVGLGVNASNAAGGFASGAASMALTGVLDHYFFQGAPGYQIPIPLDPVGAGGSAAFSTTLVSLGNLAVSGTIYGNAWTTGAVSLTGPGGGMLAASGFDNRAGDGTGELLLISPFTVDLTIGTSSYTGLPGIARLDLLFTPEPGTLGLLALGLVVLGANRRWS